MVRTIGLLVSCCVLLVGCDNGITAEPAEREWVAVIQGEGEWSHLSGTATVTGVTGQFTASAEIANDEPGAVRPWHVHFNSCAEGGGIVGGDGDYPRLQVGAGGSASATATVPQTLQPGAAYHINVHLSVPDMAVIIACGDLQLVN